MPKLAGDEVLVALRERNPGVKVVFSTGYIRKEKSEDLLKLGAQGVVFKPYAVADMLETIRRVLDASGPGTITLPRG